MRAKYKIAVLCKRLSEFTAFANEIRYDDIDNSGFIKDEFCYVPVGQPCDVRGERFSGYMIYGEWKHLPCKTRDEIINTIQPCFYKIINIYTK